MHYGNPGGDLDESTKRLVESGNSVNLESHANECDSAQETDISKEADHLVDSSVQQSSIEYVDKNSVSLSTETYDPIKHGLPLHLEINFLEFSVGNFT
uniref:Uncharacterized protein n=1 Tax=Rhizophora mucronata TaxID=61149 RepID=A0A2P2JBP4_RHIMU